MRMLIFTVECERQCDIETEYSFDINVYDSPEMILEQIQDGLVCPSCGEPGLVKSVMLEHEDGIIDLIQPHLSY